MLTNTSDAIVANRTQRTFAQVLREHLAANHLTVSRAADLWHLDPDTLYKALRGVVAVPVSKIGFWSQVLGMPELEIFTAVNCTRAHLGRPILVAVADTDANHEERLTIARAALATAEAAHGPVAAGQDGAAADADHAANNSDLGTA